MAGLTEFQTKVAQLFFSLAASYARDSQDRLPSTHADLREPGGWLTTRSDLGRSVRFAERPTRSATKSHAPLANDSRLVRRYRDAQPDGLGTVTDRLASPPDRRVYDPDRITIQWSRRASHRSVPR